MEYAAPEPAAGPPVQGWVKMTPCAKCGQAIDPTAAVYSKQGELLCKSCESNELIAEGYLRAAKGSCMGALGTGVLSVVFDPIFCLISIAAILQGVRAIILINRREYREVLGRRYTGLLVAAIFGTLCGLVRPGIVVLSLLAIGIIR